MLFRSGLNAKQVQVWLGHHSPAFTLGTYVHLLSDDLPDAGFLDGLTGPGGKRGGNQPHRDGPKRSGHTGHGKGRCPGESARSGSARLTGVCYS
jgi:hypothetical protein